jgi:hypothetical protein
MFAFAFAPDDRGSRFFLCFLFSDWPFLIGHFPPVLVGGSAGSFPGGHATGKVCAFRLVWPA